MNDVMGIIYTSPEDFALRDLTATRAVSALPLASSYRAIDFVLSSMVNTGVRNVGVIMQKNYLSLIDHLGSGHPWDLHTRVDGLRILPPTGVASMPGTYMGLIDALNANMNFLRRSHQEFVIVGYGNSILNADLNDLVLEHINTGADLTIAYTKDLSSDLAGPDSGNKPSFMKLDDKGRVTEIEINPNAPSFPNMAIDLFVIRRKLLMFLINRAVALGQKSMDELLRDSIRDHSLAVHGYEFNGFYRAIETVQGYFRLNLDLINPETRKALFGKLPVFTKTRNDPPAKYMDGSAVKNSLVGNGCIIEGTVENSVLFRGVHVARGAVVRNSVLMQDSYVMENAELENVIFDKDVTIRRSGRLVGQPLFPIVVGKGMTL